MGEYLIMASLSGKNPSDTYIGLIKSLDSGTINTASTTTQLSDGSGNALPLWLASDVVEIKSFTATAPGTGFDGATVTSYVKKVNGEIESTFLIDIGGGSIISSAHANDVIGEDGAANAYFTRITTAVNGIVYRGEMSCIEVPTTGDADINLCANSDGTIAEDADGSTQHTLVNGGTWTLGLKSDITIASGSHVNDYLYLTHGGTTAGGYDAGKFIIKLYGANF
tara:strand:- start:230 stop:901 length:672 start_codon:yes stop_codon:yes gene_type:complete